MNKKIEKNYFGLSGIIYDRKYRVNASRGKLVGGSEENF